MFFDKLIVLNGLRGASSTNVLISCHPHNNYNVLINISACVRDRVTGKYFRLSKLWCICMAPVLTGTLNYRKVNLSGGLAIGEFSSSIIKLFPLGGKKMGREGGREGWRGREIELTLEIKLAECDHVRGKRNRACSP